MASKALSEHLADEEILGFLYAGAAQESRVALHLANCADCRRLLQSMPAQRAATEQHYSAANDVSFEFLTAQRRSIYARIERQENAGWWFGTRRWVAAAGLAVALASGVAVYEQQTRPPQPAISDAQLAAEVGQFANDSTPQPAEPISALFEE